MTNCTAGFAEYPSSDACLGTCTASIEASGNLSCRTTHAGLAAGAAATHCPHAGPGGAGVCGANCASFCALAAAVCPGSFPDGCATFCASLQGDGAGYFSGATSGNTFACRMHALTLAAVDTASAATHCPDIKAVSPHCQ